jgi:hypothetical protein
VLETAIGKSCELQQLDRRQIDPNFVLCGRFASDTRGMLFQPARFSQRPARRPKLSVDGSVVGCASARYRAANGSSVPRDHPAVNF